MRDARAAHFQAKEEKAKTTFNLIVWIFLVVSVVAKVLIVCCEPVTIFTYIPVVLIGLFYGLAVGWAGKSTQRSRRQCIIQAWIEAGASVIGILIAAMANESIGLYVVLASLAACWIPMVAALITRGKEY